MNYENELRFRHFEFDDHGIVFSEKYFDYIESVKENMPESLYKFAKNYDRYDLNSSLTLHDSWVESFSLENSYHDVNGIRSSIINLKLLLANKNKLHLTYCDVVECIHVLKGFVAQISLKAS